MKIKKLTSSNLLELAQEASDYLKRGNAIIYPTDTLYALGVDALNEGAINHFFSVKKRPANKPVPLFVKDIEMAGELAFIDKRQKKILERAWPGSFTFILHKRDKVSSRISAGTQKVGLRIPDNDFAQALLNKFAGPITASSANISGEPATANPAEISKQFSEYSVTPDYFVDAGILENAMPSMVIDITGKKPQILRMNSTTAQIFKEIIA
ncbi:MAG: threonylcarbamoyl-AMP synthase [Candidatus Spechtbacteria bacterium RIFCSPLOWO2_01_FULL_46_10]|uniref:L-threonylcarbamoyladenylate synthase n=1 Tax=Candidatus Spechtbacteria bacterium RIFCSPLOWO2_01_FULL_46_10 TaxID=1802163 RepID=A0A1G2HHN8_9BACT|nr:MAG: threonylcarbamoyl-AMP synthase [Candidatus Spechtbacteria bacterium RIFCSPLOWO2_01_FULL_46_10]